MALPEKPLKLYKTLNDRYGHEWWDWEPETLWSMMGGPSTEVRSIVMALQTVLNTNFPFELWNVFEKVGHAFNGGNVDFEVVQPLEPDEVSLTIYILKTIRPKIDFEPDVLGYIAATAHEAGLAWLPPELFAGAQQYMEKLTHDKELAQHVKNTWPGNDGSHQLGMLHEVKDYVKARL